MLWTVLGSSQYAAEHIAAAPGSTVITCNGGIELMPIPDVYFLSDAVACRRYRERGIEAQRHGTRLVTLDRVKTAKEARGVDHFDEFVRNGPPFEPFVLSGLFCLEYAILSGAQTVILAGMTGYTGTDAKRRSLLRDIIEPKTRHLVEKYPRVQFDAMGPLAYSVTAHNWRVA